MIKPRLQGTSNAEMTLCPLGSLSKNVKEKLTSECNTEVAILQETERQYGVKDRLINQIHVIEDVLEIQTPNAHDPVKCSVFHRSILIAVNDC